MEEKLMSNVSWGSANREKAAVHSEAVHSPRPSSPGARIASLSQATGQPGFRGLLLQWDLMGPASNKRP